MCNTCELKKKIKTVRDVRELPVPVRFACVLACENYFTSVHDVWNGRDNLNEIVFRVFVVWRDSGEKSPAGAVWKTRERELRVVRIFFYTVAALLYLQRVSFKGDFRRSVGRFRKSTPYKTLRKVS